MRAYTYILFMFLFIHNITIAQEVNFDRSNLIIKTENEEYYFNVEVASTYEQRSQGLMHRKLLKQNDGMIFIYPKPQIVKMWMKNTYIPLDMIFIKENGEIDTIIKMTKPLQIKPLGPETLIKAVLEINGGLTTYLKINKGDIVISTDITGIYNDKKNN